MRRRPPLSSHVLPAESAREEMLDPRRLRYFLQVIESGSVRAAADVLGMDPSALSRAITILERSFDARLFQRHGRGLTPTDAGQLLTSHARRQLSQQQQLLAQLEGIRKIEYGHVDIVAGEGFADWLMRHSLGEFMAAHPNISVSLDVDGTDQIVQHVVDERAQIGMLFQPPGDDRLRSHYSHSQPIQALVLAKHPLTRLGRPLKLADLLPYPGATLRRGFGVRQHIEAAEISEGIRLKSSLTTTSFHAIGHFVAAGLGYALSTRPALAVEREDMVALPMDNPILHRGCMHVISKHGRLLSPAPSELLRMIVHDLTSLKSPQF